MADRYFSESPISAGRVVLVGSEAHHLIHVMRAKRGAQVVLFDGTGAEFNAQVESTGRNRVELVVLSCQTVDRELPGELILGVPVPKGDRQRWLVEKAVELGVARLVPLVTARSVGEPRVALVSRQWHPARLRRTVIEASKQCGRNRLMEIAQPRAWAHYVADAAEAACRLLAQPHSERIGTGWVTGVEGSEPPACRLWGRPAADHQPPAGRSGRVLLAIGPEGGLTTEEVSLAVAAGWQMVDFGPRVLRVETAAVILAALVCQVPLNARH